MNVCYVAQTERERYCRAKTYYYVTCILSFVGWGFIHLSKVRQSRVRQGMGWDGIEKRRGVVRTRWFRRSIVRVKGNLFARRKCKSRRKDTPADHSSLLFVLPQKHHHITSNAMPSQVKKRSVCKLMPYICSLNKNRIIRSQMRASPELIE